LVLLLNAIDCSYCPQGTLRAGDKEQLDTFGRTDSVPKKNVSVNPTDPE
jgi:hypothetical protein